MSDHKTFVSTLFKYKMHFVEMGFLVHFFAQTRCIPDLVKYYKLACMNNGEQRPHIYKRHLHFSPVYDLISVYI